ncbi:MAG TPA: cytochrome b/b6 domain-containing protein [Acidimicrobiales bacterium]|jgi:formate dehydrogenase subunit gamma
MTPLESELAVPAASVETEDLRRFTGTERALHWTTATLVLTVAITGLILYVGQLSALVGRRDILKNVHVISGLAMPVPLVLAYVGRGRDALRADIRRMNRWSPADRRWLLSRGRQGGNEVGKFNAGQKANAAFIAGMIPVMMATGGIMRWFEHFSVSTRTGATFVHDWIAIATWFVVAGHIVVAISKPPALRSMFTGRMPTRWARRHHPVWANEMTEERN